MNDENRTASVDAPGESVNTNTSPRPQPASTNNNPRPKRKLKKALLTLIILLLLAGLGWLYYNERGTSDELRNQLATHHDSDQSDDSNDTDTEEPVESTSGSTCEDDASYTAEESNIELALEPGNIIIVNLDGGFEGGPATSLTIATCDEGESENNVFSSPIAREVKITSLPANGDTTYHAENPDITTETDSVNIDGKAAKVYVESGLFEKYIIFLSVDGFNTTIEGFKDGDKFNPTTQAVLDGLTFAS